MAPTLAAFALRLVLGLLLPCPPTWDGALYHRAAQGLARGLGYSCFMFGPQADPTVATAYYPVGLPAYLAGFYAVLGDGNASRALAGAIAGAAATALSWSLARRFLTARGAGVAAWLTALSPGPALFAAAPMTETLWGALLTAVVLAASSLTSPTRRAVLLAGALLTAASLVRPQALALVPLLPLIPKGAPEARMTRALGVAVVVLSMLTPWALRNCATLDGCALISTNGAGNFAIGAVPRATGEYLALTAADGCGGVRGEVTRARCWSAVSRAAIRRDPWRWVRLAAPKVWHTWGYEAFPAGYLRAARPDLLTERGESSLRRALTIWWCALVLAALASQRPWPRRGARSTEERCILATLGAVTVTHAVFFGGDRYHLALVPLITPLAASALTRDRRHTGESSDTPRRESLELQGPSHPAG